VKPETVTQATSKRITLSTTVAVDAASAQPEQFDVTTYDSDDGWSTIDIAKTAVNGTTITVDLKEAMPQGQIVRFIARGTGPGPILGADFVPLAGAVGGPPGSVDDGHDFVIMLGRS
jgi:hypothetical protein